MRVWKRAADVALSALGLAVLLPFYPLAALIIRLDSPGKTIYAQQRVGRHHRLITVYKLRTMHTDAAPRLYESKEVFLPRQNDPRVTRVGAFLRKYGIDELPQLYNVLKGEMSLIGPRPLVQAEMNKLPPIALGRLSVRPGITGLAQAEVREGSVEARLARDLWYAQNIRLRHDLRILWGTLRG